MFNIISTAFLATLAAGTKDMFPKKKKQKTGEKEKRKKGERKKGRKERRQGGKRKRFL